MANNHKNFAETTLAAAVTDTSGTSITVTSSASFPSAPFIIGIDTECLLVTNVSGTTWTVTRGYESSTAATHLNGAAIYHDISAAEADAIAGKKTDSVSATDKILGRSSEGSGPIEEIACTAAGRAILDDVDAAAQRTTLGAAAASHSHAESDITNLTTDLAAKAPLTQPINAQTGTTYTFVASDAGKLVTFGSSSATTVTVPKNDSGAFAVGTKIDCVQVGAGKVTFSSDATINSKSSNKSINGQYVAVTLLKTDTDTWLLIGDLQA